MKELLLTQAKYNKLANQAMFDILNKCNKEIYLKECGIFYKNIFNEISHLLAVEIAVFLGVFNEHCQNKVDCSLLLSQINDDLTLKVTNLSDMAILAQNCDEKIIEIINKTDDFNIVAKLNFPGITFEKTRGLLQLAILNHSTHHRGVVAAALDILGIENDFNGMLGYKI